MNIITLKRQVSLLRMTLFRIFAGVITPFFRNQKTRIAFSTFDGKGFCDNSKYIALEIIKRKLPWELVWITNPAEKSDFPPQVRRVDNTYLSELYYLSTAAIWVDTHLKRHIFKKGLRKRKDQFYIQTWHGSLGIKKILNAQQSPPSLYYPMLADLRSIDALISNSIYEDKKFRNCFSTPEIQPLIYKFGHPRNDIFFTDFSQQASSVKRQYGVADSTKIFTYMPTFRKGRTLDSYNLDFAVILESLKTRFGGNWCVFLRLHPTMTHKKFDLTGTKNVIDVTLHADSQEIQLASDILCTDYSSCIYDFVLTRRPGFIFTIDLHDYETTRGLCYPLTETPFPIAQSTAELSEQILHFNEKDFHQKVEAFLQKQGCVEDGHAAKRIVDMMEEFIQKNG